jgi:hypothetical protein
MTPDQAARLLGLLEDYVTCSDLRMYAWARRRWLQEVDATPRVVDYARGVEARKAEFAEQAFGDLHQYLDTLVRDEAPEPLSTLDDDEVAEAIHAQIAATDSAVLAALSKPNIDSSGAALTAAAGFVVSCWRDTIEAWHDLFTDAEMSWMSVMTTRDVAPYVDFAANRVAWVELVAVLTDAEREVLPDTPARDAFGPAWRVIVGRLERCIADQRRHGMTAASYVGHALNICPEWWGAPQWPVLARRAAQKLKLDQRQTGCLITAPYELPLDTWERVIDAIKRSPLPLEGM